LHRLEQEQIGAAFDERSRLLAIDVAQLLVRDIRERRIGRGDQHSGGSHGARDEARVLRRRDGVAGFSRDCSGLEVELLRSLAEAILVEF
jgi:hypothetical protein